MKLSTRRVFGALILLAEVGWFIAGTLFLALRENERLSQPRDIAHAAITAVWLIALIGGILGFVRFLRLPTFSPASPQQSAARSS